VEATSAGMALSVRWGALHGLNYHDGFVIVMLLLPDRIVFNRGGPGHRIADGAKECNFYWESCD